MPDTLPPPTGTAPKPAGMVSFAKSLDKIVIQNEQTAGEVKQEPPAKTAPVIPEAKPVTKKGLLDTIDAPEPIKEPVVTEPEPKSHAHFKKLENARDAAEKQAKEYKAKLDTFKDFDPELPVKYTALQTQVADLEKNLELASLERTPKFRQKFIDGRENILSRARALATEVSEDTTLLDRALALKGKDRRAFLDENVSSASAVSEFTSILSSLDNLDAERTTALNNHKETLLQFQKEQEQSQQQETQSQRDNRLKTFDSLKETMQKKLGASFTQKEGDENDATRVESNYELARSIADGTADPQDIAAAGYLAVAARDYMRENTALKSELAKYKARLTALGESEAEISGKIAGEIVPAGTGKPMGMRDRMKQITGRA